MITKALLTLLGVPALRTLHNPAVHDARNARAAALAAHDRIVRLSAAGDIAAASGDTGLNRAIVDKQSDTLAALDELARRIR